MRVDHSDVCAYPLDGLHVFEGEDHVVRIRQYQTVRLSLLEHLHGHVPRVEIIAFVDLAVVDGDRDTDEDDQDEGYRADGRSAKQRVAAVCPSLDHAGEPGGAKTYPERHHEVARIVEMGAQD